MIRSMQLNNTRSHTSSGIMASTEESVDDVGEGEATGGLEVTTVTTDIGISLRVSPDQASLSDESLQGGAGQFSLLVEGIVTQPASLGSSCERGVTVTGHQVPGLQELAATTISSKSNQTLVLSLPDQYYWSTIPAMLW